MRKILTVALLGTTLALAACGGNTDETAECERDGDDSKLDVLSR